VLVLPLVYNIPRAVNDFLRGRITLRGVAMQGVGWFQWFALFVLIGYASAKFFPDATWLTQPNPGFLWGQGIGIAGLAILLLFPRVHADMGKSYQRNVRERYAKHG
jgi:hypothetical protein